MHGVIYARYSGDKQRETSIDDQVRNCTRHAERENIGIQRIYHDKAVTGAVTARGGYQAMLGEARQGQFQVLIVDDLSRLSRDDYEMKGLLRKFIWQGLRVIGVSDGYDSSRKGHKIHAGFKGLMNEIFLDDLRERTHRGMTGQAMKGFNCGGRTFGYRNVPIEDTGRKDAYGRPAIVAVRYEIDEGQGAIVRDIFSWYAQGYSYKWIAAELNRRKTPSSRGGTWAMSAVKVILENEMYAGRVIWNRRAWAKHPDTGKRTYRERPQEEWIVSDQPELRVVTPEIVEAVRRRQRRTERGESQAFPVSSAQRYLFSGLMVCAACGSNIVLAAKGRYGCAAYHTRGAAVCSNSVTVSRLIVEQRLLQHIKERLLEPGNAENFNQAATRLMKKHNAVASKDGLRQQLQTAERTRRNILEAIKQGIVTPTTKEALQVAEAEVATLTEKINQAEHWNIPAVLPRAFERYHAAVLQLEQRLGAHVEPAREILKSLLGDRIRLHRRGEYLEAELASSVQVLVAKCLNGRFDLRGCGGAMCFDSTFVSLAPTPHIEIDRNS
jgi:site-specific DNA recombinase